MEHSGDERSRLDRCLVGDGEIQEANGKAEQASLELLTKATALALQFKGVRDRIFYP